MARREQHSNRETKKPKKEKRKAIAAANEAGRVVVAARRADYLSRVRIRLEMLPQPAGGDTHIVDGMVQLLAGSGRRRSRPCSCLGLRRCGPCPSPPLGLARAD
jgi:hypothetical protein